MGKKYILYNLLFSIGFIIITTNLIAQPVSALHTTVSNADPRINSLSKAPLDGGVSILLILGLLGGLMIINTQKVKKKARTTSK